MVITVVVLACPGPLEGAIGKAELVMHNTNVPLSLRLRPGSDLQSLSSRSAAIDDCSHNRIREHNCDQKSQGRRPSVSSLEGHGPTQKRERGQLQFEAAKFFDCSIGCFSCHDPLFPPHVTNDSCKSPQSHPQKYVFPPPPRKGTLCPEP